MRTRILLPVLLLAVCLSQAFSSVCRAKCVEHQVPAAATVAMPGCHAAMAMHARGVAAQTCPALAFALCSVDLLANEQAKFAPPAAAVVLTSDNLLAPNFVVRPRIAGSPRSRPPSSPLILSLRI